MLEDGFDGVVAGEGAGVEALAFDFGGDGVLSSAGVVAFVLAAEVSADFGFGVLGCDKFEPIEAGGCVSAGDEIDDVAVLEAGVDFPDDAVDLCTDDAQTKVGVDAEGEVNGGGVDGHVEDVALGGEDEDLLAEEVHADGTEEVAGGDGVGRPVEKLPAKVFESFGLGDLFGAFFIRPVRGDAELGDFVHVAGADLDFDGVAARANDFGMEALVAIRLGSSDVVAEEALHGQEERMGVAESAVAVIFGLDDNSDRDEVKDLLEWDALLDDFVVDAVEVLGAADDLYVLEAPFGERFLEKFDGFFEFAFALGAGFGDVFTDFAELFGVEDFEGEVFELPLELPNTEAGGERGVDVEGFVGDAGLFVVGHRVESAHVVEAVGEFDDHHADVAGDGEEHFAEVVAGSGGI